MKPFDYYNYFLDNDSESSDWSFKLNKEDVLKFCKHRWVDIGIIRSKVICKDCDLDYDKWEKYLEGLKNDGC